MKRQQEKVMNKYYHIYFDYVGEVFEKQSMRTGHVAYDSLPYIWLNDIYARLDKDREEMKEQDKQDGGCPQFGYEEISITIANWKEIPKEDFEIFKKTKYTRANRIMDVTQSLLKSKKQIKGEKHE